MQPHVFARRWTLPMFPRFERPIHLLAGIALAFAAPLATAQVQLNLTTTQQQNCTAVTDAQGLRLATDGVNLQATGVTLSGNGCGGGNTDFQVAVSSPASVTAATPFNVNWSASAAATQCFYSGTSGITNWPVGGSACSGSACAGAHVTSVSVASGGSYTFGMICTNASGAATSSSTATGGGPPTPNGFALSAPATATTGTPFSVSWSVNGATACSGTASLNGSSASLSGWTDSTSPTSPRNVTASVAGTYTLQLVCSNASPGNATSQQATVVVTNGVDPDQCPSSPMTRLTTASVKYPNVPQSGTRSNLDLTKFENIWGHMNSVDNATAWPGVSGTQPAIMGWGKTQYVAAKFHVPAGQSTASYGFLGYGTYFSGPNLTLSISSTCGDFAPANPQCLSTHTAGESFSKWRIVPATLNCPLTPGQDYFINLRMENPTAADCSNSTACTLATNNTFVN